MGVQPIKQILHRQATGQMRANGSFVHVLEQLHRVTGFVLRKSYRLRLVLASGSHNHAYFVAQLQLESALITPDG